MKSRYVVPAALLALTGCTSEQITQWVDWHDSDPVAAEAFANTPDVQAQLHEVVGSLTSYTNNHPAQWERIAWCESGRQWHLRATNRTGTYGGGLMIRDNVWRAYGGLGYASTADRASKAQQIDIAERILADVGWHAWDCA